ncbi:hypothetical protein [Segatella hominis]
MKKKIILGLAMTMVSLLGNAAANLPGQQVVKGYKGIVIKE